MAEDRYGEGWHPARLIPAIGIRGQEEQEKRATSSLLAVMRAVPEFGYALLGPLGAPKGRVAVEAPGDGRPATRVNWVLRQLKEAPDDLLLEVSFANTKATTAGLLSAAKDDPQSLLLANDPRRLPRAFRLALSRSMGTKRGKGERSFVLETRKQAIDFYRDLVQNLRPWRAAPPKLPDEPDEAPQTPTAEPPPFTAAEVREPTEGEAQEG
jgi:hypothetical protein